MELMTLLRRIPAVSLRRSILALAVSAVAAALVADLYYRWERSKVLRDTRETLAIIAELKTGQFREWLDRHRAEAEAIAANPFVADDIEKLAREPGNRFVRAEIFGWLWTIRNSLNYRTVQLFDTAGRELAVAGQPSETADPETTGLLRQADSSGGVVTCDFSSEPGPRTCLDLVAPVMSRRGIAGFIMLRTDPDTTLLPLLELWPASSRSGEVTVFRQHGDNLVWLTHPRHMPSTPALAFSIPFANASAGGLVAARVLKEQSGAVEGLDYRGVPVVAQATDIKGTDWHLVAKIDRSEALAGTHTELWLLASLILVFLIGVGAIVNLFRSMQTVTSAQRNEADLRGLLDAAPIGVIILRKRMAAWGNAVCLKMTGYGSPGEIEGRPLFDLIDPSVHGEIGEFMRAWESGFPTSGPFETRILQKDGKLLLAQCQMVRFLFGGSPVVAVFFRDLTDEKKAEVELLRQEKLQTVTALTGGIAHDINNLLTAVTGNLALTEMKLADPAQARYNLGDAGKAAQQIKELVNRLSAYARGVEPVNALIEVKPLLEEAVELARTRHPFRAEWRLFPGLRPLLGDRPRLLRTLEEVIDNAAEAGPAAGGGAKPEKEGEAAGEMMTVALEAENLDLAQRSNHPPFEPGQYLRISVRDRGKGIPAHVLPRIFDPYFSTRHIPSEKGPGLGLHFAQTIVRKHRGHLAVESTPGEGTTVTFILPAAPSDA